MSLKIGSWKIFRMASVSEGYHLAGFPHIHINSQRKKKVAKKKERLLLLNKIKNISYILKASLNSMSPTMIVIGPFFMIPYTMQPINQ